jgi:uroporphyrinogen-III synthase
MNTRPDPDEELARKLRIRLGKWLYIDLWHREALEELLAKLEACKVVVCTPSDVSGLPTKSTEN